MTFDDSFETLVGVEGNFGNDSRDPGNWTGGAVGAGVLKGTKYGISAAAYPDIDIKNLTLEGAKVLYGRDYWDRLHLDELPASIRYDLFDAAVNSGVVQAIKFLQEAVGVVVDGVIGPATIAAANLMTGDQLDKKLSGHRLLFMANCKVWPTYARGWARRIANNLIND